MKWFLQKSIPCSAAMIVCIGMLNTIHSYPWVTNMGPGGGSATFDIVVDYSNENVLYLVSDIGAGMLKSTDGGLSWRTINKGLVCYLVLAVDVSRTNPDILFSAGFGAVHKSTDGGENWTVKRNGFPAPQKHGFSAKAWDVAIHPTNPDIVYVGVDNKTVVKANSGPEANNGIYKTTDGGENWSRVEGLPTGVGVFKVVFDLKDPNTVWAGTNGNGMYKSTDGGKSWQSKSSGLPAKNIWDIEINTRSGDTVYVGFEGQDDPVWMSGDGGNTWQSRSSGLCSSVGRAWSCTPTFTARALGMHPTNPEVLVYVHYLAGIFKSTDAGKTWREVSPAWGPKDSWWNQTHNNGYWKPSGCVFNTKKPNIVYALGTADIFRSVDEGESWHTISTVERESGDGYFRNTGFANMYQFGIAFDHNDENWIYVHQGDNAIFMKSDDKGVHWRHPLCDVMRRRLSRTLGNCILTDPDDGRIIYLGFAALQVHGDGGIFKSTDRGETFTKITPSVFEEAAVQCMAIGRSGTTDTRRLYIICEGNQNWGTQVHRSDNSGKDWKKVFEVADTSLRSLAIDPRDDDLLYLAGGSSVHKTTDGGSSWTAMEGWKKATEGMNLSPSKLKIDPNNPHRIYVGTYKPGKLYRSVDGGKSFKMIKDGDLDASGGWRVQGLAVSPYDSNQIFCSFSENPYKINYHPDMVSMSTDGGDTWKSIIDGLNAGVYTFEISPHEKVLYVGTAGHSLAKINLDLSPTATAFRSPPRGMSSAMHHTFSYPATTNVYDLRGRLVKKIAVSDAGTGLDGDLRAGIGMPRSGGVYIIKRASPENGIAENRRIILKK